MFAPKTPHLHYCLIPKKQILFLFLLLLIFPVSAQAQKPPCHNASIDLHGSVDVVMGRGGLWGYMEKSGLREKSMLGLQIDGKLQRLVVIFETLCEEGKSPGKSLHEQILSLIGDARMVFNLSPEKISVKKISTTLNGLSQKIDALLGKMNQLSD